MKIQPIHKLFAVGITFGTAAIGLSKILSFFLKLLVSRIGVSDFGDYYLVSSTFINITTISALGIPMSTTRFLSAARGKLAHISNANIITTAFVLITTSAAISGTLLFICAIPLATYLGAPHIALYLRVLSFGIIGALYTLITRSVLLGYLDIQSSYIVEGTEAVLRFICVVTGIWLIHPSIMGAIIGFTVGSLLSSVVNIRRITQHARIHTVKHTLSHALISYAWPVGTSEILTSIATLFLIYLMRFYAGAEMVGIYAAAVSIAGLIHLMPQMILSIFLPAVSKLYSERKSIFPSYKNALLWLSALVIPPTFVFVYYAPFVSAQVFGKAYTEASTILPILTIAYGVYALFVWPNRQLIDMAGHTKLNLLLTCIRIFVTIFTYTTVLPGHTGTQLATSVLVGWSAEAIGSILILITQQIFVQKDKSK